MKKGTRTESTSTAIGKKSVKKSISKIAIFLLLAFVVIISVFPILWVIMSSFKTQPEIFSSPLALPKQFNFHAYAKALTISPILEFYGNSIIVAVVSTVANIFLVGMAAYVLARFTFKGKGILTLLFYSTLLLAPQAISYPIFLFIKGIGLYNTKMGLIFVYTALGMASTLFIMRSFFSTIPKELSEAAEIDGAGFFKTYIQVILPVAKPGLATAAVLQFLMAWNEFYFALMLTTDGKCRTLPLAYGYFNAAYSTDYAAMFAAIVITIVPSIIVYFFLQEQVIAGLSSGAVKG